MAETRNEQIKAELRDLQRRIKELEQELAQREEKSESVAFPGYYNNSRGGIGGPHGGGRTARPQRRKYSF